MKAFKFLFAIPVLTVLLAVFSFTEKTSGISITDQNTQKQNQVIGDIRWEGNTKYTDEQLTEVLGIKPGDIYEKEIVENLLNYDPDRTTVSDLYMDNGYLFFNVTAEEEIVGEKVNLVYKINEGATVTLDKIVVKGNKKIPTDDILKMMEIKKGDLFSRSKLISTQKNIAMSGYFNPKNVGISPIPHDGKFVDIEFTVEEL